MLARAACFAAGTALAARLAELPPPLWLLGAAGAALWLVWRCAEASPGWLIGWLLAGAVWLLGHASLTLHAAGLQTDARHELEVRGCVHGPVRRDARALRFVLAADRVAGRSTHLSPRLALAWYGVAPALQAGDCLHLRVRLRPPLGFMNPGAFDRPGWLFRQGIAWQGYVRARLDGSAAGAAPVRRSGGQLTRLRLAVAGHIGDRLGERPATALVQALAVGLRDGITDQQWLVLRRTGTAHLVAVSGLHIGLVSGAVFAVMTLLCARLPCIAQRLAAARAAAGVAALCATAYAALAGFSLPTRRALLMLAVVLLAVVLRRRVRPGAALGLALIGVLLLDPMSITSPGAWLSFAAVAVLLYGMAGVGHRGMLTTVLRAQWLAAVGLAPLLLMLFGEAPLLGVLANAVAVPLTGTVVVPLVLIGVALHALAPALGGLLWWLAAVMLEVLFEGLEVLAAYGPQVSIQGAAGAAALAAAAVGVALLLAPRGWPLRVLGVLWLAPLLLGRPQPPAPGTAQVTVLDVGQGLAVLVRTHESVLLYDTGPPLGGSSAARQAVLPFLQAQGIERLDRLMVSHPDIDHAGGVSTLLQRWPDTVLHGDAGPRWRALPCLAGQQWWRDGVRFQVLHPPGRDWPGSDNDRSCVLRISAGSQHLLLPGDLEARGEATVLSGPGMQPAGRRLAADVLVAGHHGSASSSSVPFIAAVRPRHVVFAAGAGNRWGFPHGEVVERFQALGVTRWNTATHGAVRVHLSGSRPLRVEALGERGRRFWQRTVHGPWLMHGRHVSPASRQ